MAVAAEQGRVFPWLVTLAIAGVLGGWGLYAFSGANILPKLPFLKPALTGITAIYCLRAMVIFPLAMFKPKAATLFMWWSSAVCAVYGAVHVVGLITIWDRI